MQRRLFIPAAVLARVDRGAEWLDRRIALRQSDLLAYAPVTKQHVRDGSMSVARCAPPPSNGATTPRPTSC
jgi:beta-lactamase class A